MPSTTPDRAEWLEADGLGGFASGCVREPRSRRYHALLLAATKPPTGRFVLVNGLEAWLETPSGRVALTSERYAPDVVHPDGVSRIESFVADPWPRWRVAAPDGTAIDHEILVERNTAVTAISWRRASVARSPLRLSVRLFFCGRDYHSLHHENGAFGFAPEVLDGAWRWRTYPGLPPVVVASNGAYRHDPLWFRNFLYVDERERGLDATEDLASPGVFSFDLAADAEAAILLAADGLSPHGLLSGDSAATRLDEIRVAERKRRSAFATPLDRAADAYVVPRGGGRTIVAGYPWFTDWGRDTFIALRGLCLATGRLDDARDIVVEWAGAVSQGMLPNRFPDRGEEPEFNSVDASLWYVVAASELLAEAERRGRPVTAAERRRIEAAIVAILAGHAGGTRYGIHADTDGLLAAGAPGLQLTWMDARIGDWVVTPRIGKPVEIQALWIAALAAGSLLDARFRSWLERARRAFAERFWNESAGALYDVVDADHRPGAVDASFRPNQIFAVGGLPIAVLEGERARRVVDAVEARLWTPLGLRSLDPGDPAYVARYRGGPRERDGAYHQGTVWPWLAGPFVEAWVRVRGGGPAVKAEARQRFLQPLLDHLGGAGVGHVSEIADAEAPHAPRGCPFQAWSLGELLRLDRVILASS